MNTEEFKDLALSFHGTISIPHFDRIAFKVEGKRIFATLHEKTGSANVLLTVSEQQLFCEIAEEIYPVSNNWGTKGWTTFEIMKIERAILLEALSTAYEEVLKGKKKK